MKYWRPTLEKLQLPWIQVYGPNEDTIYTDYAIQSYPTKIVINPEGKILEYISGELPEFYEFIENLFSKK